MPYPFSFPFGTKSLQKLVVARHGDDERLNLTDLGRKQVCKISKALAEQIEPDDVVTIIASDTSRTSQTARIIAEEIGHDPGAVITSRTLAENCSDPVVSLEAIEEKLNDNGEETTFLVVVGHEPQTDGMLVKLGYGARPCDKGEANLITSEDHSVERLP
jgi:phosphohistidine phosphatase SixA